LFLVEIKGGNPLSRLWREGLSQNWRGRIGDEDDDDGGQMMVIWMMAT